MSLPESPWLQGYVGPDKPRIEEFDLPTNTNELINKPEGGLWTSPIRITDDGDLTCPWLEWCRREHWEIEEGAHLWILEPREDPEPAVLTIDSRDDMVLFDLYSREDGAAARYGHFFAPIDFEEAALEHDAIYLTEEGQWETRLTAPSLYGWDCESVLWLDWVFTDVRDAGPVS